MTTSRAAACALLLASTRADAPSIVPSPFAHCTSVTVVSLSCARDPVTGAHVATPTLHVDTCLPAAAWRWPALCVTLGHARRPHASPGCWDLPLARGEAPAIRLPSSGLVGESAAAECGDGATAWSMLLWLEDRSRGAAELVSRTTLHSFQCGGGGGGGDCERRTTFDDVCLRHDTDKASRHHGFCSFYDQHIDLKRVTSLLEVGVKQGNSLAAWAEYIPDAKAVGLDISPNRTRKMREHVRYTDQTSKEALASSIGDEHFDLIIDDGGHTMQQQQNTLDVYWPHVKPGGAFIVEDLHTSYMDYYQTPGDRPTVDVLQDSTPEDLDRMRCNFEPGEVKYSMTCILFKRPAR